MEKVEKTLKEMEEFAKEKHIPIVLPDTREYLKNFCKEKNPQKILEVGTAIGYSASNMLLSCSGNIVCCEASKPNIVLAKQNFEKLGLTQRVKIVEGDCLKTLGGLLGQKFDLIFLDGPKGFYPEILKLLLPLLGENGTLIADNIGFRGMVSKNKEITENRFEKTVEKLKQFLLDLQRNKKLETKILFEMGDGISVSTWRK